jgi:hypothetical protein
LRRFNTNPNKLQKASADATDASKSLPQKAGRITAACISINSLRAKCPGAGRGMQVLSFHIYCTLSFPCAALRLAVILAELV